MAPNNSSTRSLENDRSSTVSPTDARGPPPRFESAIREEEEDASDALRPSRSGSQSGGTHGSTMSDRTAQVEQPSDGDDTPTQDRVQRSVRSSEDSSIRQRVMSPDTGTVKIKKPGLTRRASSKFQIPQRGQEFSVDDDPDEYSSDYVQRKLNLARAASGFGTLRRQPSTLRRRQTAHPSILPRLDSRGEDEAQAERAEQPKQVEGRGNGDEDQAQPSSGEEGTILADEGVEDAEDDADDDDEDLSDAESFTLKDRQDAINETHPFGIRIWKPALYKKDRSVQKTAEGDIHSSPGGRVNNWLWTFNILWTVIFGWWLALAAALGAVVCFILAFTPGALDYGRVLWGLAKYLFYPFGQFVKLEQDEAYAEEDEGEGRSISEYEQWQNGDLEDGRLFFGPVRNRPLVGRRRESTDSMHENDSLLGRGRRSGSNEGDGAGNKRRLFGRGQWNVGRVVFFVFFYFLLTPLLILVSGFCWLMVFWIPMGKVTLLLFYHLRRHPLALSFHSDGSYSRGPSSSSSSVLLCTYRAVGLTYWKYTIDGTNIFLINLIAVVLFAIFDYWVLDVALGLKIWLTHPGFVFALALFSIVPLAYFIGQAVASISAQSSMGVGAATNAFFSTLVEVFLYCVALNQGKAQLVEGSIIGSIFAGVLFLPGLSMCFGAIKRKTQRFNVKSAGVTSTMLLFAVIAAFGPTLFYQIYGSHEFTCKPCYDSITNPDNKDCRRCSFSQVPAINDRFFIEAVRPYCWFAAVLLFLSYIIGLWFTLRTHAAVIWNTEIEEKKLLPGGPTQSGPAGHGSHQQSGSGAPGARQQSGAGPGSLNHAPIRESQLYKRILGQSLRQVGIGPRSQEASRFNSMSSNHNPNAGQTPYLVPPKSSGGDSVAGDNQSQKSVRIPGLSDEDTNHLVHQVAEMAATAATVAARDVARAPRKTSAIAHTPAHHASRPPPARAGTFLDDNDEAIAADVMSHASGGHDAPNWSRMKSCVILLGATVLYAVIAEILVNTVDIVLESVEIDEKFLGITLFALVPNTTEFLNAISFAMNGNIALSMEIGSAYALQVCLLQIPALVLFSAVHGRYIDPAHLIDYTFNLIFPEFDMVTVILCVFLLSYMYGEGKSNYFKGSILVLTYLVVIMGFYFSGYKEVDALVMAPFEHERSQQTTFKTSGRGLHGRVF